jgi:lipopolysaccharide transport system ATP-binding protein
MTTPAVVVEHVSKRFLRGEQHNALRDLLPALARRAFGRRDSTPDRREFWALQDVSFTVQRGEAFAVIGHNGAGKSTILKHLSGIMKPTRGTLRIHGRLSALIEIGAGFHPDLTGRENIFLNGTILGMKRAEIQQKFDDIVAFAELAEFIDTPLKRYSSGMQARLGFSVAAHLEPDILVIDEVLSVGDYSFQRKSLEKMNAVIRSGATVIFVSHNLRAVAELCQRAVLLHRGRIVSGGPVGEVIGEYLAQQSSGRASDSDVVISRAEMRGENGPGVLFESGQTVWVDVEIQALVATARLAVVLWVGDANYYYGFDTSTERLGVAPVSLEAGETYRCTFRLQLHLAAGTFHLGVAAYRYDIQREYVTRFPAATFFVTADRDVRGVANLYPEVVKSDEVLR